MFQNSGLALLETDVGGEEVEEWLQVGVFHPIDDGSLGFGYMP